MTMRDANVEREYRVEYACGRKVRVRARTFMEAWNKAEEAEPDLHVHSVRRNASRTPAPETEEEKRAVRSVVADQAVEAMRQEGWSVFALAVSGELAALRARDAEVAAKERDPAKWVPWFKYDYEFKRGIRLNTEVRQLRAEVAGLRKALDLSHATYREIRDELVTLTAERDEWKKRLLDLESATRERGETGRFSNVPPAKGTPEAICSGLIARIVGAQEQRDRAEAERDALAGLLRETLGPLSWLTTVRQRKRKREYQEALIDRIDAALAKSGKEGE